MNCRTWYRTLSLSGSQSVTDIHLGAVITTRKIAEEFANGMEYFNTFGGNQVSCSVGMAVLDIMENEGLQQNALETGSWLKEELEAMKNIFPLIGDVRGEGFVSGC